MFIFLLSHFSIVFPSVNYFPDLRVSSPKSYYGISDKSYWYFSGLSPTCLFEVPEQSTLADLDLTSNESSIRVTSQAVNMIRLLVYSLLLQQHDVVNSGLAYITFCRADCNEMLERCFHRGSILLAFPCLACRVFLGGSVFWPFVETGS